MCDYQLLFMYFFLCVKDYIKRDNFFKSIPEESIGQLIDEYDPIFRDEYVTIFLCL